MVARSMPAPLVSAVDVSKHFVMAESFLSRRLAGIPDRRIRAVDGVSMSIYPGETVGLVGESGCGKSTFGRTVVGLLQPTSGQVYYGDAPIWGSGAIDRSELKHHVQIIFQNPYSSLNPRYTVGQTIGIALAAGDVPSHRREAEALSLMARVGLSPDYLQRYPHQLSGGQRQRVGIARALATRPSFIVADEPLSSLDVSVQAQTISLLQDLQDEYGLSYLLIAHDLRVVYHMCQRVAVMYAGQIVESAPTDDLFQRPLHPFTKQLLEAIPGSGRRRRRARPGIGRVPLRSPHSAGAEASTEQSEDPIPEDAGDHVSRSGKGCRYEHRCKLAAPICQEREPELLAPSPNLRGPSDSFPEGSGYEPGFEPAGRHLVRCHMSHD